MAQKVNVQLVDDLDGTTADSTVEFALDGVAYEIDLSNGHAAELRDSLASYVSSARRVGGRKRRGKPSHANGSAPTAASRRQNQAVREWAREQGMEVSDRGRIPAEVMAAYEKRVS